MGFFAFFNTYTLRNCLPVAITKMTKPLNKTDVFVDEACPDYNDGNNILKNITKDSGGTFDWDEHTQV